MFLASLLDYFVANSGIAGIESYLESMPAPKATTPNYVALVPSIETPSPQKRDVATYTVRILVSGSATGAINKAWEVFDFFIPIRTANPAFGYETRFTAGNYFVMAAFWERQPHLLRNTNNIFIAQIVLRFLAAFG